MVCGELFIPSEGQKYKLFLFYIRLTGQQCRECFKKKKGRKAKSVRVALGALIIKEKLNLTDEETVEQIRENPYLQFFLGFEGYRYERPFEASMMTYFRRRLGADIIAGINEIVAKAYVQSLVVKPEERLSLEQSFLWQ